MRGTQKIFPHTKKNWGYTPLGVHQRIQTPAIKKEFLLKEKSYTSPSIPSIPIPSTHTQQNTTQITTQQKNKNKKTTTKK